MKTISSFLIFIFNEIFFPLKNIKKILEKEANIDFSESLELSKKAIERAEQIRIRQNEILYKLNKINNKANIVLSSKYLPWSGDANIIIN